MKKVIYRGDSRANYSANIGFNPTFIIMYALLISAILPMLTLNIFLPITLLIIIIFTSRNLFCIYYYSKNDDIFSNKKIKTIVQDNYNKGNPMYISRKNKFLWQRLVEIETSHLTTLYDKIEKSDVSSIIIFDKNGEKIFQKNIFSDLILEENLIEEINEKKCEENLAVLKLDENFKKDLVVGNEMLFLKLEQKKTRKNERSQCKIHIKNISNKKILNSKFHFFYLSNLNLFLLTSRYHEEEIPVIDKDEEILRVLLSVNEKKLVIISTFMDEEGNEYIASSKI